MAALHPLEPTPGNVAAVRITVAEAFVDDPMFQWLFPHDESRPQFAAAWLGLFVEAFAGGGTVDVVIDDDQVVGAALWRTDDAPLPYPALPNLGGLLVALLGPERSATVLPALGLFAEHKPEPPFHYLQFLAVHPAHQGRGLGRVLVSAGQQRAAAAGQGVYLESTNARNLPFYRSMGLQQIGEFTLGDAGPSAYRMWWAP